MLKEPKCEAGKRPVAIPSHIMPLVEAHLERYVGPEPTAWLYGTKNGQPMLPRNFYRAWQKARQAAGRPDLTLHDYADVLVMPTFLGKCCSLGMSGSKLSA